MTPDCPANFRASPAECRALVERIGKSQRWIAERIGIGERKMRYLQAGAREVDGKQIPVELSYSEYFALQCLASASEAMRRT